ncbi:MAG: alpha/beta hydrolase [Parvibaculaceae bacterium]
MRLLASCGRTAGVLLLPFLLSWPAQAGTRSSYAEAECPVVMRSSRDIACGTLTVPERWDRETGKAFRLPIVTFHADRGIEKDPVLVFLGGPGESGPATSEQAYVDLRALLLKFFSDRRVIILETRGAGGSEPHFGCPELEDPLLWAGAAEAISALDKARELVWRKIEECAASLVENGLSPDVINRHQVSGDAKALVDTLGLKSVVLFGVSYGTAFALTTLGDHPDIASAMILDSVVPPEVSATRRMVEAMQAAFSRIFDMCDTDQRCKNVYPRFREDFTALVEKLDTNPKIVELVPTGHDHKVFVRIDGVTLVHILKRVLSFNGVAFKLPGLVKSLGDDSDEVYKSIVDLWIATEEFDATPVLLSGHCFDYSDDDPGKFLSSMEDVLPLLRSYIRFDAEHNVCARWPAGRAPASARRPVVSSVPTLILQGGIDPLTSQRAAERVAKSLSRSHLFIFPRAGHSLVVQERCAPELARQFLADPLQRPDPACLRTATPTVYFE